jgi:hypothetical protein
MENIYHISIVTNKNGVTYFEMTDFIDVAQFTSVEGCLGWFGLDDSEESIKKWTVIAYSSQYKKLTD